MNIGDTFPNFQINTTVGDLDFYEWMQDSWAILFSHPADFTPVCTTELARVAQLKYEFAGRNVKPIALSCDTTKSHLQWIWDIKAYGKLEDNLFPYPIINDSERELAVKFNMLDRDEVNDVGVPVTCRAVFLVDPTKKLRMSILYPASTGRNFDEILRVIDSIQLTDEHKVATPADWKVGGDCMVLPLIRKDDLSNLFPKGVRNAELPSGREYIRVTPYPAEFPRPVYVQKDVV